MNSDDKEHILYKGDWIHLCRRGTFEYVRRVRGCGAAIIIAVTDRQELLLVEQYRHALDNLALELPAGLIGDDVAHREESMLDGAKRELLEETGYEATSMRLVTCGAVSAGISAESMHFCLAEGLIPRHSGGGDSTENIIVHHVPLAHIHAYLEAARARGIAIDPKIYIGLYFIAVYSTFR